MLISENWSKLLEPGLRKIFDQIYKEQPSMIPVLYSIQKSSKAKETDLEAGDGLDFAPMNGTIPYDDMGEGYTTEYTHAEYARGFKIERKLVDDDQYNIINKRPRLLAISAARRREKDAASVFNNAFNASIVGGDGVCLCNAAHPSKNGGANQSNVGALALTPVNLEATRRLMTKFRSDRDGIISVQPDMLLLPLELEEIGYEIINSKGKVDTAQNNVNFHYGRYKMAVWPNYLTSASNWFLIDSTLMKQFLLWFNRIPVEFMRDSEFDTQVAKFAGYMRYSNGYSGWRWIYGNQV